MEEHIEITDTQVEAMLDSRGLNAPRLTLRDIDAAVKGVQYYVFPCTTITVCCLTLQNGYGVIGMSACVSPDNFDEGVGRSLAYQDALRKVWELEGYLLRDKMHRGVAGRTELP